MTTITVLWKSRQTSLCCWIYYEVKRLDKAALLFYITGAAWPVYTYMMQSHMEKDKKSDMLVHKLCLWGQKASCKPQGNSRQASQDWLCIIETNFVKPIYCVPMVQSHKICMEIWSLQCQTLFQISIGSVQISPWWSEKCPVLQSWALPLLSVVFIPGFHLDRGVLESQESLLLQLSWAGCSKHQIRWTRWPEGLLFRLHAKL